MFLFSYFCDLLSKLEALAVRDPPLLPATVEGKTRLEIKQWFQSHRRRVDASDTDAVALLSAFFPERRVDRVYNLQPTALVKVLGRCLGLGISRRQDLERWKVPGAGDLAVCVERVLSVAEFPRPLPGREVTIEEIDIALERVASRCRFSSHSVQAAGKDDTAQTVDSLLGNIYRRLQSREAKWFTRMILKSYAPVVLPERFVLKSFHHLLPVLLHVQDSFEAAVAVLRGPILGGLNATPLPRESRSHLEIAANLIVPKIGIKVGRPNFWKARSIRHAVKMAGGRRMSLERKYDGEYCQIHIDLLKANHQISIFSKSGKDSTNDKLGIHSSIGNSLRIGSRECLFSEACILEGELVVWSDQDKKILEFHKIRKHVSRSGTYLGTTKDSQPSYTEHLMIVLYDVLLIDKQSVLQKPHIYRRKMLEELVSVVSGRVELAAHKEIDFSLPKGAEKLKNALAYGFSKRWEGFVLKPSNEPYLSFADWTSLTTWIKLKKDYIPGLGDTADIAVIGAGYDAAVASRLGVHGPIWTHYHVGCLQNKDDVLRFGCKPKFLVLDAFNQGISKKDLGTLHHLGEFRSVTIEYPESNAPFEYVVEPGLPCKMDVVFNEPFVFEVKGGGFDKPPDRDYFVLRFPRLVKVHWDREFKYTVSFNELQQMAREARTAPVEDMSQDIAEWARQLEQAERGPKGRKVVWENSQKSDSSYDTRLPGSMRFLGKLSQSSTSTVSVHVDPQDLNSQENHRSPDGISSLFKSSVSTTSTTMPSPTLSASANQSEPCMKLNQSLRLEPKSNSMKRSSKEDDSYVSVPDKKPRYSPDKTARYRRQSTTLQARNSPEFGNAEPLADIINSAQSRHVVEELSPKRKEKSSAYTLPSGHRSAATMMKPSNVEELTHAVSRRSQRSATLRSATRAKSVSSSPTEDSSKTTGLRLSRRPTQGKSGVRPCRPDLSRHFVVLSPCVSHTPYLTEDLLLRQNIENVGFPQDPSRSLVSKYIDRNLLILVEPHREAQTGHFLHSLLLSMPHTEQEITVWDWRLAEYLRATSNEDIRTLKDFYIGQIRSNGGNETMVMQWKRGEISKARD